MWTYEIELIIFGRIFEKLILGKNFMSAQSSFDVSDSIEYSVIQI